MGTPPGSSRPPGCSPGDRDPAQVAPAGSYRRDETVWIYRDGGWHPGVVNGASPLAVMVTYQSTSGRGTVVDTVTAEYLARHNAPQRSHPPAGRADPAGGER